MCPGYVCTTQVCFSVTPPPANEGVVVVEEEEEDETKDEWVGLGYKIVADPCFKER
jgi:hypothetical protein